MRTAPSAPMRGATQIAAIRSERTSPPARRLHRATLTMRAARSRADKATTLPALGERHRAACVDRHRGSARAGRRETRAAHRLRVRAEAIAVDNPGTEQAVDERHDESRPAANRSACGCTSQRVRSSSPPSSSTTTRQIQATLADGTGGERQQHRAALTALASPGNGSAYDRRSRATTRAPQRGRRDRGVKDRAIAAGPVPWRNARRLAFRRS
jgi:hypothetical protein